MSEITGFLRARDGFFFSEGKVKGYATNACQKEDLLEIFNMVSNGNGLGKVNVFKKSLRRTIAFASLPYEDRIIQVCLKYFKSLSFNRVDIARPCKAVRVWNISQMLLNRGIPVACPIAVLEKRQFGFLGGSLLITQWLSGFKTLAEFLNTEFVDEFSRRQFIYQLAAFIGNTHQSGVYHGDFHSRNILVKAGENGLIEFKLTDVDSVRIFPKGSLSAKCEIQDLAHLNCNLLGSITKTERLRFFKKYFSTNPQVLGQEKVYLEEIERLTKKIVAKSKKRLIKQLRSQGWRYEG